MKVWLLSLSAAACLVAQQAAASDYDAMIARHAAANGVPADLVRRVMMKESGGRAHVVSAGNYGLMQIRHGTARGLGYRGSAAGLLDPETNLTYAVKYLAGAYRVAGDNHERAIGYYQRGYYYAAKRKGLTQVASHAPTFTLAAAETTGLAPSASAPSPVATVAVPDMAAAPKKRTRIGRDARPGTREAEQRRTEFLRERAAQLGDTATR